MWQRVPDKLMTIDHGQRPVVRVTATPPGGRKPGDAPIVQDCTLITATVDTGECRYFGVDEAHINSRLQMVCRGGYLNPQNELARLWPRGSK